MDCAIRSRNALPKELIQIGRMQGGSKRAGSRSQNENNGPGLELLNTGENEGSW